MTPHPVEQLGAFLDGELGAADREQVERHLRACAACAQSLEELAVLDTMVREAPVAAPEGYFDALPGRIRARLTFRPRRKVVVPAWSWAVAAALLLAVIAPRVLERPLRRSQEPGPAPVAQPAAPAAPAPSEAPRAQPDHAANPPSAGAREAKIATGADAPAPARSRAPAAEAERLGRPVPESVPLDALAKKEAPSVAVAQEADKDRQAAAFAEPPAAAEESAKSLFRADSQPLKEQVEVEAPAAAPPPASAPARNEVATTQGAAGRVAGAGAGAGARDEGRAKKKDTRPAGPWYSALLARQAQDAEAARALREEWRAFAEHYPGGPRGDEARVRVIEAGLLAWRLSNDPADKSLVRQDAFSYLRRDDAAQGQRVRSLLNATGG